jgi:ligand-binding sensor domain-containing protein
MVGRDFMSDTLWVGTRKGLVRYINNNGWQYESLNFQAEPVSMVLDTSDGTVYCALNLGHFGPKLHRSDDNWTSWTEISVPAFSKLNGEADSETDGNGKSVEQIFCLEKGHAEGELWAGTIPVALFHPKIKVKAGNR